MTEQVDAYFNPEPGFVEGKSYLTPRRLWSKTGVGEGKKSTHNSHICIWNAMELADYWMREFR